MKKKLNQPGQKRVVIDRVEPSLDGGAFPIKRVLGESVQVEADILADGHDLLRASLLVRPKGARTWRETPLKPAGNDLWRGCFSVDSLGYWEYTLRAWIDHSQTWREGLRKKHDADVADDTDLEIGAALVRAAAGRARGKDARRLEDLAATLADRSKSLDRRVEAALEKTAEELVDRYPDLSHKTELPQPLRVWVDRERAGFSAWYELFPRSAGIAAAPAVGGPAGESPALPHGTFRDVIALLPEIARMGFDILYLPPIHPIGETKRKGRNNTTQAAAGDPGSPWAIGSAEGGHKAIHPRLGSREDFLDLVEKARTYQMEIALDIAFQCSPDHPWVEEHPQWFVHRPDGSIQYAENPPKKYEDIYPLDFETDDWEALWNELLQVFLYWIDCGVQVFRVDNPHTKSFPFWEWLIEEVHQRWPEVIFLAEAFTRPKRMYRLAKGGFTQSYTYFTWRNSPEELRQYLTELTREKPREFFRPNFWPNTPDILHEDLQSGNPAAFAARLVLAATLSSNYGIYGPAYELLEHKPVRPGSEEYLNSEKYEIRTWNRHDPRSIAPLITRVNEIRRKNRALQSNRNLRFHAVTNPHLLCYSKTDDDGDNIVLVCVNMDYSGVQSGKVEFSLPAVGPYPHHPFVVRDLLSGHSWTWHDYWNYLELDPAISPVHLFVIDR
ncbi:alpha-1,4-glucan--maltose-1-phosphate maltosyltransferase [Alkalispirochaeta alkalica]|uniref:alpha-1,4-glucan--maltose-1-phosphate maltosyltransferase n=1 Tax=Alkalispirochaeta alkalica TaxID=46356 RepID=UPI0003766AD2|nr:alpha-1,4-glucan--maltose-1-phosphate maltosyltransferase [Alkalispirochaeta alkalica]